MSAPAAITEAAIREIVRAAVLAPSTDNSQPFEFCWTGSELTIDVIPDRARSFLDVQQAAVHLSLGAALTNIDVAAHDLGWAASVELFPPTQDLTTVARIRFQALPEGGHALASAIGARCTNRQAFDPARAIPPAVQRELLGACAHQPGVSLSLIDEPAKRDAFAELAAAFDKMLFEHRDFHAALFRWVRWTSAELATHRDGLPIDALGLSKPEQLGFRWFASWKRAQLAAALGLTGITQQRNVQLYRSSAAIGVIAVEDARRELLVNAGEDVERLWLTATAAGLSLQPLAGLAFLVLRLRLLHGEGLSDEQQHLASELEAALTHLVPELANRLPVMLFRLGYGATPRVRAPRRAVEDALRMAGA